MDIRTGGLTARSCSCLAQEYVGKYIATFKDFPPSQRVGGFSLDQVLEKLQSAQTAGK